jgi:hypothetical protein
MTYTAATNLQILLDATRISKAYLAKVMNPVLYYADDLLVYGQKLVTQQ